MTYRDNDYEHIPQRLSSKKRVRDWRRRYGLNSRELWTGPCANTAGCDVLQGARVYLFDWWERRQQHVPFARSVRGLFHGPKCCATRYSSGEFSSRFACQRWLIRLSPEH